MLRSKNSLIPFFIILIMGWTGSTHIEAQEAPLHSVYNFEIFELPGGQSANSVQAIVQDSFGFMWFGTQFGLYRWNGYNFKAFLNDPEDSLSVASNYVECLTVGKDGSLWVGYGGKGLSLYNHRSETFEHIDFQNEDPEKNPVTRVNSITEGSEGNLWIGTGKGLYRFNRTSREMKLYQHDPDDANSLSYDLCRVTYIDRNGTLWVGTGFPWFGNTLGGLNRYRPETDDFIRYLHDPEDPNSLIQNKVSALFEDSRGNFWVGTNGDGLHIMDRKTGKFQRLQQDPNSPNQLCAPFINNDNSRHVRFIMEDMNQKIWIGALHGGIKYYDPETGYVKDYFNKKNDPQSLPEQNAWTLFQSKDGTYWAASNGPTRKVFKFRETSFLYLNLPDEGNTVYSFSESRDNNIWVGTDQGGLLKYIKRTQQVIEYDVAVSLREPYYSNYNFNQFHKANKLNFFLKSIEDQNGNLWIRKFLPFGLFRLNIATGVMTYFENDPEDDGSIAPGRVTDILIDGEERLWSITSSGHLNHYNPETEQFIKYRFLPLSDDSFELNGYFLSAQSIEGDIWIATTGIDAPEVDPMLLRFEMDTKTFKKFETDFLKDDIVFRNETIQGIAEDDDQNVWLCSDTKLIKYIPLTGEHVSYRAEELGALFFKSMILDKAGRLWLFGDKITLFDPDSEISSNYVASYNMQPNANYTQYVFMDSKGLIYFGGKEGFQILEPRKIGMNDNIQPVETIIENFQFLDENSNVDLKEHNSFYAVTDDKISLKHNQNAFTFNFSALDFESPENNRHQFILEGYDDAWRSAGSDPSATYVKVPPGDYTFKVRGATLRSEWGPGDNIQVHISAPWWATWWAYITYGLVSSGILYAFYNIQVNRRLDQAEADRLKEIDTVKTRLYTNITHEFRTPLTVISGMASQIKDNPKEWFNEGIVMIQRNTNRLLDLVNQMLDLSKLESGKLMMNAKQGDIVNFIKYIIQSVHSFAETKNIEIHFYAEDDEVIMDFDHEKIQQIMTNLLSNAIKFTPEGGNIYSSIEIKDETKIKISVRDTGQGIIEKDLPYIFDRFYQVDSTATRHSEGTGIGLALVKELINLMKGEISVKSKLGQGTEFYFLLPIENKATEIVSQPISIPPLQDSNQSYGKKGGYVINNESISGNAARAQVLLIEDNPDVVAYIASCLQDIYHIKVGMDGQEGVDIALDSIPDLIVTDVMMPQKDGFQVCKELKRDERTSHIPIIMLTAKADIESKLEGLEQGADAYLEKPFNKDELQLRIKKLLELRQNLQQYYLNVAGITEGTIIIKEMPEISDVENNFVKKARHAVEEKMEDFNFSVDDLCKELTLSHSQVHRKLTALTGYSAQKFIRFIRLTKAKELLADESLSITAVAFDTGFSDPNYFSRVFRKEFGVTPSVWREQKLKS